MPLDCDDTLLSVLVAPPVEDTPTVTIGHATSAGREVAGARVSLRSRHPVAAWAEVLRHPERAEEWLPEDVGTRQVERLDATHIYQRSDISFLFGAAHIRRQAVIGFRWREDTQSAFKACWFTSDPTPYLAVTQAWDDQSAFLEVGYGAWDVQAGSGGGSVVSYQLWATARMVPAQVTAWVLSQGLPDVVREYEKHVGQVTASR